MEVVEQASKTGTVASRPMMRQYELVERVRRYNPNTDEALLNRAYVYAMKAHGAQKRASGAPYISHPLEVAGILTDLKLDDSTIVAALLHDTIEDTGVTRAEIAKTFGNDIAQLVDGLTKIKKLDLVSKRAEQAEHLRKLLLAIADDMRVLLVKLADRLHNMRTLQFVPEEKRNRIAEETLDIYAPLAGRMGMHDMREELEDLSFRQLSPDAYRSIEARLATVREKNKHLIEEIEGELTGALAAKRIRARVTGREKKPYSIWKKMERKAIGFEQLSDIYGFRVVVGTIEEIYRAIGVVHMRWPVVPGRFKDYISTPKQNDYRSIHTTVVGPGASGSSCRSARAKWKKSPSTELPRTRSIRTATARRTRRLRAIPALMHGCGAPSNCWPKGSSSEEFLEHTKLELFHDQVFCFTPKGRLIALPRKATPIDFAYAVHTDVGNNAVGCKINGKVAPLVSELMTGDEVEIVRGKGHAPPAAWESIVVTGKARAAIRRATRSAVRKQYTGLGRQMIERAFVRAEKPLSDDRLQAALARLARPSIDDVYASVGRGEMRAEDVVRAAHPDWRGERKVPDKAPRGEGWFGLSSVASLKFRIPGFRGSDVQGAPASPIPIRGTGGDLPVRFAPKGGAVPGDRIVGIVTPGEGITIYPIQSPALKEFDDEPERWLDVRWDIDEAAPQRFPAQVMVHASNAPGTLAQIAQVISEHGGNIDNIRMARRSPDFTEMTIDIEVYDLKHLTAIIAQLRAKPVVASAERVNG
jgi:GTP diphosphokinase / guanosine-3',5'-bis(diphosphate) 3'-diphosphatase